MMQRSVPRAFFVEMKRATVEKIRTKLLSLLGKLEMSWRRHNSPHMESLLISFISIKMKSYTWLCIVTLVSTFSSSAELRVFFPNMPVKNFQVKQCLTKCYRGKILHRWLKIEGKRIANFQCHQ